MMGWWGNYSFSDMQQIMASYSGWWWLMYLQWLVLWALGVVLLVAAIRWLWKKGNK